MMAISPWSWERAGIASGPAAVVEGPCLFVRECRRQFGPHARFAPHHPESAREVPLAVKSIEDLKPVYLIFGDEELLLERALHRLRDRIAEVADLDFNYEGFDGETADADAVVAAANTLPFASDRRLVVVRAVDKMNAASQAVLAAYAKDPAPTACLVLVATKMRKDSKLFRAVDALHGAAEYKAPRKSAYPSWVVELFASKGRKINLDAAGALVRAVGPDLRRLEIETDKILAYTGERTDITRDDVASLVAETAPVSVFDFLNALGARDCTAALERLDDLIADGQDLAGVHAMTLRHLRSLISARAIADRGGRASDVQREVGMAEWQARNMIEQARRFSPAELSRALREAATLEAQMKSGNGEPSVNFEMWVVRLCSGK